ncbi:MAG: ABC transporter ATP-binding protein [Nitrospirota bacterium]
MIEIKNVSKTFTTITPQGEKKELSVLQSVSLEIKDGEFVSLIGPSGCGKSTLLEIIAGLQIPSTGEVYIDGKIVLEPMSGGNGKVKKSIFSPLANRLFKDFHRFDIAMVFQDYAVFPWMTCLENVTFVLKLRGMPKKERVVVANQYLDMVGLSNAGDKYPSQLSGGMRQRLALARALSIKPKIIFMDEPFGAVDCLTRERLQEDLLRIWEAIHKTIVYVTHDIAEAVYLSDRVIAFSPYTKTIHKIIQVNMARPRNLTHPDVKMIRDEIREVFNQ